MLTIPLTQIPTQTFTVVLAGQYCTISLYWRQECLYLDLNVGMQSVCQGSICQNKANIVQSRSQAFTGTLHFFDLEGDRAPQWEKLHNGTSGRWVLVYIPEGEEIPEKLRY